MQLLLRYHSSHAKALSVLYAKAYDISVGVIPAVPRNARKKCRLLNPAMLERSKEIWAWRDWP